MCSNNLGAGIRSKLFLFRPSSAEIVVAAAAYKSPIWKKLNSRHHAAVNESLFKLSFATLEQERYKNGNRPLIGGLARSTNQRPPCFQLTYASKTLAHDPALSIANTDLYN